MVIPVQEETSYGLYAVVGVVFAVLGILAEAVPAFGAVVQILLAFMGGPAETEGVGYVVAGGGALLALVCGVMWLAERAPDPGLRPGGHIAGPQTCAGCGAAVRVGDDIILCGACGERSHRSCRSQGCRSVQCRPKPIQVEATARPVSAGDEEPGTRCPYCHADLLAGEARRSCTGCSTTYHSACLAEAGCTTLGCDRRRSSPQRT